MSNCEFLGTLELDADGNVRVRRSDIPPPPVRPEPQVRVPSDVMRAIRANRARVVRIVGDSMQPGILHNDSAVVSTTRSPRDRDVVVVSTTSPHPIYGEVAGCVWRYHNTDGCAYLTKDNPRHRDQLGVTPNEILGVITRVLPRQCRDELENYERVQREIALFRDCKLGQPPPDAGFFSAAKAAELREVIAISPSELIFGRLPWGLFRGVARHDHRHLDIATGDTLTIEPSPFSRVGVMTIEQTDDGETVIGILQREGLDTPNPGEFYIDLTDRRIALTRKGGRLRPSRTIGLVRHVERGKRRMRKDGAR